jgi:hypothetical protein
VTVADVILTRIAHAENGDNRFRGFSVNDDLAGKETWLGVAVLGITGRRLNATERDLLDDLGVALTVGDPHIWPLKLGRLAASYGGTLAGLAAGALSLDEARIGYWTTGEAARFLVSLRETVKGPHDVAGVETACRARLTSTERLIGFGVAFRPIDERVVILTDRLAARGRDRLEHWQLFTTLADVIFRLKGLRPNMTMAAAAACLDLGFDAREVATVISFLGLSEFLANAAEGAAQMSPALQSLDPAHIRYVGPAARESGRSSR